MVKNKKTRGKISRIKLAKMITSILYASVFIFAVTIGGFVGRLTAPTEVETLIEEVIVSPEEYPLSEIEDIMYLDIPLSNSLQEFIHEICTDRDVPMALAIAIIEQESDFNPEIVSETGDYGLMQINEINHDVFAESYQCNDIMNPYQNVYCGITIISFYLDKYNDDYNKALMAYNMGDYGANKAWDNGINSTDYSTSVLELFEKYRGEL